MIRSGTTRERLIRWGLFTAMCAVASGLFFYDGFVKWPRRNAEQAAENFPGPHEGPVEINALVTRENCATIRQGMGLPQVKEILGEPAYEDEQVVFWVGPGGFLQWRLDGRRVGYPPPRFQRAAHPAADLATQKFLGALAGLAAIVALTFLVRAAGTRVVLDDAGLTTPRTGQIRFEQMKSLDTERYKKKGWVTLHYDAGGEEAEVRLDSYHVARFDEIISELCQRTGFESPLEQKEVQTAEEDKPAPTE
jgi:hypothetical protein